MLTGLLLCRMTRFLPGLVIGFCVRWLTEGGGSQVSTWLLKDLRAYAMCTPQISAPVVHMQPAQKRITRKGKKAEQAVPSAREDLKMVSVSL